MDYKFIDLKEFNKDLIAQIIEMEQDAFGEGGMNSWFLPPFIRHGRVFLLVSGGQVLAATEYMRDFSNVSTAYLFGLVVKKEYRNRGLGYKLLSRAHSILQSENINTILLTVAPTNLVAQKLYLKLGFQQKQLLINEYGIGIHRQVWELNLINGGLQ